MKQKNNFLVTLAILASSTTCFSAEVSTDPGDVSPLPPGVNLGLVYYQHASRDAYFSGGNKLTSTNKLDTDIALLRFVHYTTIGNFLVNPQFIIPFGSVNLKDSSLGLPFSSKTASGVGDPLVGASLWLWQKQENKESIEVTGFISLPLGNYDYANGPINLGENRWKAIGHIGYSRAIFDSLSFDIIGEVTKYGDNDKYISNGIKKEQKSAQSLMMHLKYSIAPSSYIAFSYFHDFGGETSINGNEQSDKMNNSRWLATYATFVEPSIQLQVQFGQAIKVQNGFEENSRLNLRLLKVF